MPRFRLRPQPWIIGGTGRATVSGAVQIRTTKALGSVLLGGNGRTSVATSGISTQFVAPTWSSAPVISVPVGTSATIPLPVSANGVGITLAWVAPGQLSSYPWITLNSGVAPSITISSINNPVVLSGLLLDATANGVTSRSPAGGSITIADVTWGSVPNITFVAQGGVQTRDLKNYITNWNQSLHKVTQSAGTLPSGVTLASDGSGILTYDNIGTADSKTGIAFTIVDSETGDWLARSTAPGVVFADAWDTLPPVTSSSTPPVANGSWRFANDFRVTLDTIIKPTGASGSIRMAFLNDQASYGQTNVCLRAYFGATKQFTVGDEHWFSFRMYAPREYLWQPLPASSGSAGHKFGIMSWWGNSHTNNECVPGDSDNENGATSYIDGVVYDQGDLQFSSAPLGNAQDFRRQIVIDRGANPLSGTNPDGGAWNSWQQIRARYGPTYSARSNPGAPEYRRGYGDPFSSVVRVMPSEWVTITICNTITSWSSVRHRMWIAREGRPYVNVRDTTQAVYSDPGVYNTFWPMPYVSYVLDGGRKVTARTNNITGISLSTCGLATPIGTGTLSWNATTQTLTWAGNGEVAGAVAGFSVANNILVRNVCSGSNANSYLVVEKTGTLPLSNQTDTVTIADGRPDTHVNYAQFITSTLPINAPGGFTFLESAANALAPNSWAVFTLPLQNAVFGSQAGGTGSILHYANEAQWIPQSRRVGFVGSDHTGTSLTDFVWYDESSHSCARTTQAVPVVPGIAHGFCLNAVNPHTGDYYFKQYGGGSDVYWKPFASTNFSLKTTAPLNRTNITYPTCWWSGSFVGGGAEGCLVIWNEASDNGQIVAFNPLNSTWWNQTGKTPSHSTQYNGLIVYSPVKNCAIYGGGNSAPTKIYRLNSDGSFTVMPDVPSGRNFNVGIGYCVADRGTGNFLHLWGNELWELNPDGAGAWTQITTSVPSSLIPAGENGVSSIVCGIPAHNSMINNVIMFIKQDASADATCYLYRRA